MGTNLNSLCASFLVFSIILHSCLHYEVAGDVVVSAETRRKNLEIMTDGGGYVPPPSLENELYCPLRPPVPACPTPLPPPRPPPPPPVPRCPTPTRPPPPPPVPRCPTPPPPPCPLGPFESGRIEIAYNAIQKFKSRITLDPQGITDTWVGNDVCNKYKGFVCDTRPDLKKRAVAGVDLNGYNIGGQNFSLSDFLEMLEDLAIFHANSNTFGLSIPKMISKLIFLYELDVSNNKLSGGFPMEVLNAKNLSFLDIRFNAFSGPVPSEIFDLDLDALFINNNKFTQNLPENLGSTRALYLTFANNNFTGPIPKSIGQAKYLLEVLFLNNNFTGCLPYEIGFLSNATLFDVSSNQLTGPIPHSFGCLANMNILNLARNQFYGPVPEVVCKLTNLTKLTLANNYITQVGAECRKLIERKVLDVSMNCIRDLPFQRSSQECRQFFSARRNCSDEKSLTLIPCDLNGYPNISAETSDRKSMVAAPSFKTYDALIPHRL